MRLLFILFLTTFNINIYSQDYYEDRLFIKLKNEYQDNLDLTQDKSINFILSKYDKAKFHKAFRSYEMRSVYEVQFKDKVDLTRVIAQLEKYEYIEYAEKIPIYKLFYTPNDPQYSSQWNLAKIQADQAWNLSQGCSGIKVAITDDGFLMNHEDLVNQWYVNSVEIAGNGIDEDGNGYIDDWRGWDAANNDNDPSAFNPTNTYFTHGTHVAGIVGGATNNSLGIASIGFNNKLIPIKIGRDLDGALTGAQQGLDYAINSSGCDVINMSWGGTGVSATFQLLFNLAYSKGIICVAASGNSSMNVGGPYPSPGFYPASYNHVISVAASTNTDAKAGFSNYGTNIDVTAPGANILSCLAGGISSYGNLSGTSMASPLVAGLCGLMKCYNPMPVDSIEACLKRTCDNINSQNPSYVGQLGAGRINALQALQCLTQKPISDFYAKDTQQCIGKPVRYFATSFGIPTLTYSWSFPGGSPPTSTSKNPQVSYAANGTYSATLTTTNGVGSHTVTKTNIVTIGAPKASLIGRKYTSYNSNAVIVTVKFTGNPPFNVTLTDGTNNFTQNNITANPYYFSIVPLKDTSLISISAFSDTQCVGTKLGQDTIYKITLGSGSISYCESSFKFNGTSNNVVKIDKYNGANWKDLYSTNGYTWECWFNLGNRNGSSVTGTESLVAASDAIFCEDLGLHFNWPWAGGGKLNWVISGQGGCSGSVPRGVISTNMTFNANTWYHAAGVMDYSTNTVLLYVNGQQVASGTITIPLALRMQNNVAVTIGNQDVNFNPYSSFSPFNGKIDEVRFWNSVRTPSEIQANYKTCLPSSTSNLVAYFKGDEGAGTSTVSKINGNFVGTLQNGTSWDTQVDSVKNCTICTNTSDCDTSNLIINGNFESGNTGFNTDYTYCNTAGCLFPLAFNGYSINQNASIPHSSFQGLGHGGTGNFAIYNGGLNTLRAWEQTISVTPNKNYKYSFWVNTIYTTNTANLGFYINDVLLQTINAPLNLNTWVNLSGIWNSGLITNPKLTIRCTNTSLSSANNGMDFGIDDIAFNKVCISDCDTTNLNTGLVLNLPFNGNTLDISGKGNHATNFGATLTTGKAGIPNTAYRFDSTNFMSVAHNATLNLRSFTLTAIVKPLKFNTDVCFTNNIINKGTASTGAQWAMQYAPTTSTTCFNRDTSECNMILCGSVCPSSNSITNTLPYMVHNKWECAVLTYDSVTKDVKMYMNGVLRHQWNATFNSLFSQNTANVFIGKYNDPTYPGYLQGIIDDIRVYNRVLAPSEVKGYCGTCTITPPPSDCDTTNLNTGLVLNLPFNGNTNDVSGNANHAINFGATLVAGKDGIPNTAYRFDSTNFMSIAHNSSLNIRNFTFTAKIKSNKFNTNTCYGNQILGKGVPSSSGTYSLHYAPIEPVFLSCLNRDTTIENFFSGGNLACSYTDMNTYPKIKTGEWNCVVATYDSFKLRTYVNGILRTECSLNLDLLNQSNTLPLLIGKMNDATYPYFIQATIDDLRIYNRALAPSEVKGYCGTCTITPPPSDCDTTNLNIGLVLNLPFNGNTNDVSGNGNHATNNGATPVAGKNGLSNTAYKFNGTSNFMQVAHNSTLNPNSSITMTAIMKLDAHNPNAGWYASDIISKGADNSSGNYHLRLANGVYNSADTNNSFFYGDFYNGLYQTSGKLMTIKQPPSIFTNKWYCVVYTFDGDSCRMYVDGLIKWKFKSSVNNLLTNTSDIRIGRSFNVFPGPDQYFLNGVIDDIRIYNRVLAPSEVKGYCGTCTITPPPSDCDTTNLNTGLVLNLPFNGNTNDISGNANHATNNGATPVAGKNGVANNAYRFNGTSNFMQITNSSSLNNISTITMTAILKPKGFYTGACFGNAIIQKGVPDGLVGNFALRYSPMNSGGCNTSQDPNQNNFYAGFSTGGCSVSQIYSSPYVKQDSWYCVVSTYNGDSLKTYINGYLRLACKPAIPIGSNTQDLFIGKLNSAAYPYWLNADVDDIRIYNRVLAPSEVKGYCGTCNQDTVCKSVNNTSCWVKDAAVSTYTPNTNYSSHPECLSASWTCGGSPCQARSYFDFNLSEIPTNAVIESAKLYLYAVPNSTNNGYTGQPTYGTNNASVIQRVIQSWDENTITWTNKPNTTAVNQATLSQSTGLLQNYVVDMKNLIIDHRANIASSYGFMLKHIAEGTNLNSMIFGSSDNPNLALRPRLDICYSVPNGNPIYASPPSECDSSCNTWLKTVNQLDVVTIGDLDISGDKMTIEAWVNRETKHIGVNNYSGDIVSKHTGPSNCNYSLRMQFAEITTSNGYYSTPDFCTYDTNKFYHIAMVYDGAKLKFFRNGFLMSSISATGNLVLNNLNTTFGDYAGGLTGLVENMNGYMNEIRIWNVARTQAQLKQYMSTSLPNPSTQTGLLAYYVFDNLLNKQGNTAYNGTLGGGAQINQLNPNCNLIIDSCGIIIIPPPSKPCDTARKYDYLKCTNDILQLNARQGSNYQWSPTTGLSSDKIRNPNCNIKSNITYYVLYNDTNGCQLIDTVNVMVKKAAYYSPLDHQLICNGDSVQLTIPIKATGIIWFPNTGISNINSKSPYFYPSTTTTYYLQFIDSLGCPQFDTIVVNVKPCCAARARFKANSLLCFGNNLNITNQSKNSTTYNWSFPNATPSSFIGANPPALSFPSGNSYPIRLIVSNGICFDTMIQSVSVVQVKPNAGKDTATCLANLTVNIGETAISDWSYKWTPTTYLNNATISDPVCTMINDSINYILEVTDRSSGCKGYDTVQVKTNQKIDSIVASATICQGESILFNSISIKTSGKYFYTIKKLNSICDSFINIQYVKVLSPTSIIQSPEPYCNFYIDKKGKRQDTSYTRRDTIKYKSLITCDSLILTTRVNIFKTKYDSLTKIACKEVIYNGKKYLTSKRKIDSTIIRGPYSGCDSIITHIHAVVKPIPNAQIAASKPNLLNYGDTVALTASGGFTYLWSPTNSTNTSIVHISEDTIYHTYIVTVTDTNLCWDTAMYRVKGRFPDTLYYGIPNIFSPNGDGRNDIFIPNMNYGVKMLEFYIWNRWGEKMWESHDNHGWDGFYKNKPAPASVYVYYVMFQTPWGKREYKGSFTLIR